MSGFATLGDYVSSGLASGELYKVERAGEGLKFDPARSVATALGGEGRRADLAKLMAEAPDLMLLDESTNHLDIEAIAWLERELGANRAGFVLISHDRAFLKVLTRATLWIDRGQVPCDRKKASMPSRPGAIRFGKNTPPATSWIARSNPKRDGPSKESGPEEAQPGQCLRIAAAPRRPNPPARARKWPWPQPSNPVGK